jgi:ATP-dependent Clp protease ATP-binding subunit ClpC
MFVMSERRTVSDVNAMGHFAHEVAARVADSPFKATGSAIHIYHHDGYRDQDLDVEIAVPVEADDSVSRDLVRELPPYKSVASLIYVYSPEAIQQAYYEIGQWIQSNDFEVAGRVREVMLGDSTIEIQIPVVKAGEMKPLAYPLTQRTREAFKGASEARKTFNKDYIGTEHVLIGLLDVPEGLAAVALTAFGITKAAVMAKAEEKFGRDEGAPAETPTLSRRVKLMFEEASTEATQLKHEYVGTEHILLGLLNQHEAAATVILAELGAPRQQLREKVLEIIAAQS